MELKERRFVDEFSYFQDTNSPAFPVSYLYPKDLDDDGIDEVLFVAFETQPNSSETYTDTNIYVFGWEDGVFSNLTTKWLGNENQVGGVGDVAFGDFDGNGYMDVFLSAYTDMDHPVDAYVLLNQGGYFNKVSLGQETWMHSVRAADINNDGYDDIVGAGYSNFPTYLGSPTGLQKLQGMVGSSGLALGDFLNNGQIQVIFVDAGSGANDTYLYSIGFEPTETFISYELVSMLPGPRLETMSPASPSHDIRAIPYDFSDDGKLDVILFGYFFGAPDEYTPNRSEVQFLENLGAGQFIDVTDSIRPDWDTSGYVGYFPQLLDVNQDGRLDLFLSQPDFFDSYNSTSLLLQQQDGRFLDAHREILRANIDPFGGQGVVAVGPGDQRYLVTEGAWSYEKPLTSVYIQEITFANRDVGEMLLGTNSSDRVWGLGGNDRIEGRGGNDWLDGGNGIDQALYSGRRADYEITRLDLQHFQVSDQRAFIQQLGADQGDGEDALVNIERLVFSDATVALDLDGVGGKAYRVYKAAFDREPDSGGLGYWIGQMDNGMGMVEVAARFIDSDEFRSLYGTNPTNGQFLTKVYNNVLDRDPDAGGYAWWIEQLENNPEKTWQKVLADFSESPENQDNVAELIANGIPFYPWAG